MCFSTLISCSFVVVFGCDDDFRATCFICDSHVNETPLMDSGCCTCIVSEAILKRKQMFLLSIHSCCYQIVSHSVSKQTGEQSTPHPPGDHEIWCDCDPDPIFSVEQATSLYMRMKIQCPSEERLMAFNQEYITYALLF